MVKVTILHEWLSSTTCPQGPPAVGEEVLGRSVIAELIDSKAGLAARALDGEDFDESGSTSVQLDALSHLLEEALAAG